MKSIGAMSQAEVAAYVQSHLAAHGVEVILSGGAAVGIYTHGAYVSGNIDLVNAQHVRRGRIREVLSLIGFREADRHFRHPDSPFIVEFPPGPLAVGAEPVGSIAEMTFATGTLKLVSPTDCVKDRLATYYHWGDRQGLAQAILVAQSQSIDLREVEQWSRLVGRRREFQEIRPQLEAAARR